MGCTSVDAECQEAGISAGDGVRTSSLRCWMPSQTTSSHLDLGRIFQQKRRPGVGVCVCVCGLWLVLLRARRLQMDLYGQNDKAKAQAAYKAGCVVLVVGVGAKDSR